MVATLVQPNLHAALLHYPLALITIGVLMEVLCMLFWRKSSVRTAGRWMLVLGILASVPVVTTGLYAFRQTVNPAAPYGEFWEVVSSASTWTDGQWEALTTHLTYTAVGSLLLLAGIVIWIGGTDNARRAMYLLGVVVLIAGAILIGFGAHHGSELVYRHGTGVQMTDVAPVADALEVTSPSPAQALPQSGLSALELHLLFAGCAIALLAAAIGLSIRLSNVAWENRFAEEKAVAAGYRPAGKMGQGNLLAIPVIYPGVFWALSLVALIIAASLGLWVFGITGPADLVSQIRNRQANDDWRPVLHVYYGGSIMVLAAVLGLVMKIWPRRRVIMGMLCTLLILAIIAQAWTGVLMLFDGHSGSVLRFNRMPANWKASVIRFEPPPAPATRPAEDTITVPPTTHTWQTPAPATRTLVEEPLD